MSEMNAAETYERFVEGLKKASSRCRALAVIQKNRDWNVFADTLDKLRMTGLELYNAKPLNRQTVLSMLDHYQSNLKVN